MPERNEKPVVRISRPGATGQGRRRVRAIAATALSTALLALPWVRPPRSLLVWNSSSSSPIGLYWVGRPDDVEPGDMIVAWPPAQVRAFASRRGYLPAGIPLVKPAVAVSKGRVCSVGAVVFVNGRPAAVRRSADSARRRLTGWSGCEALQEGDLFLLSEASPEAFDGRYFGVSHRADIIGKATLLWAR